MRTAMSDDAVKKYPNLPDSDKINAQFTSANIATTLGDLKKILKNSDYTFGELTATYYGFSPGDDNAWQQEIANSPYKSKDLQDEIKRHIIHALTHQNDKGDDPIPLSIKWDETGTPRSVTCTYLPDGPAYAILITGYPEPHSLTARRRRK
jgi:hypothetical protein